MYLIAGYIGKVVKLGTAKPQGCSAQRVGPSLIATQINSEARKYFIPGCFGRGLDLDLRVRPATPAPAASGNPGIWKSWSCAALGSGSKKQQLGTITGQTLQRLELKLKAFVLPSRDLDQHLCQKMMEVAGGSI